jgi:hypothetical protein
MRRHAHVSSAVVLVGLALACGGGGSGSGGGATADITEMNADEIASDVMRGILLSADLSTIGGAIFSGDVLPSATGDAADEAPLRALAGALRIAGSVEAEPLPSLPGGGVSPSAAFDPFTEPCDAGGTVTLSGNIAGSQPSAGDRINASFDNCINRDDADQPLPVLNGGLSFTIQGLSGNPEALFSLLLALTLNDLTSGNDIDPDRLVTDGSASTSFNNTVPPNAVSAAEGTNLRFERGPSASGKTLILSSFEVQLTQDTGDDTYEIEGDGQTSSSRFTGDVDYDVTETLEGDAGQTGETLEHPGDGIVLVEGAASAMRIVVLDETNVDLELDLDGDGMFPETDTISTTWTDLGF